MSLELHLSGKTAIVTGGSAGIGLAIAKALYSEGVNVAMPTAASYADRNPERLENAVSAIQSLPTPGAKVISISADLTQAEDVEKVVSTIPDYLSKNVNFLEIKTWVLNTLTSNQLQDVLVLKLSVLI